MQIGQPRWISAHGHEIWRWKNPEVVSYSHLSTTHKSSARIDLAFGNALLLNSLYESEYLAGGTSDHNPLLVTLTSPTRGQKGGWKLARGWLQEEQVTTQLQAALETFWATNVDTADPPIVWDTLKAVSRGEFISAIKAARKDHNQEYETLVTKERECAQLQADSPSEANYASLLHSRRSVELHFTELAHTEAKRRAENIFAEGDENGKLLANLVADLRIPVSIPVIKNSVGTLISDPAGIMDEFVSFYKALYSPIPSYDVAGLEDLLQSLSMPKLTDTDVTQLDADISVLEIEAAILAFPHKKAPGLDGFPADFYKVYMSQLAPRLNLLFKHCWEHGSLPASMMEAYMVLLLKPGKDPQLCSSYHPIALLNSDLKILAKVLATRLAKVISTLVDIDQTGFIPGMSTDTNLRRLFTHLQMDNTEFPAKVAVSIDIEKAFDSVDWQYMHKVLENMGFGPGFRCWVNLLYSAPRMAVRLGTMVSDFFQIGRGTRQGCPLSPFLFALMMEPLARALRHSEEVQAIRVGSINECIALYADDLLLFLKDPGLSLRAALLILDRFATFSGLRVNWGKSSILPLRTEAKKLADDTLPLQWVSSITYLGVKVTANIQDYMSLNLLPLVNRLKQKTLAWKNLPLSLMGRVSLIKMKFLSVILYFLHHSPVWIPKGYFKTLNSIIGSFIWSPHSPRISINVLQEP